MLATAHLKYAPSDRPERSYVVHTRPAPLEDGRFMVMVFISTDPDAGLPAPGVSIRPDVAPFAVEDDAVDFGLAYGRQWVDRHG